MFESPQFIAELDLKFFAQEEFESVHHVDEAKKTLALTRNLLRVLMMGWTPSWKALLTLEVAQAIFIARNPLYLKQMRAAFQEGFHEIYQQLQDQRLNEAQHEQVQLYLSNCLSLLPYSDLTAYESICIPQYIDGCWKLVEYQIHPIELTTGTEIDSDRVFAYGLEPLLQPNAKSHLIFMGTTYPAGQGFVTQVSTDAKGFESVGKSLYRTGRARVQAWLERQENEIEVCGTSLGGALSLLLAIDKGNYTLSRVDALNPPGLHDGFSKSQFDHWDTLTKKPKVVVQKQGNDPVSAFGVWKDDWLIYQITPPKGKQAPNGFGDHALNYAGLKGTTFTVVDARQDNAKRKTRNFWIFSVLRGVTYYGFIAPYTYLIRPVGYFFAKNWPLLLVLPLLAVSAALVATGVLPMLSFVFIAATLLALTTVVLYQPYKSTTPRAPYAELHNPKHSRNKHMDIYDLDNAVEIGLTYQQINTYYKVMRCLVKQKAFLPTDESVSRPVQGMTKKQLLVNSKDKSRAEEVVHLRVTKAKAALIHRSLSLIKKIGVENQAQLKEALEANYSYYRLGKVP